jgi:hypothetical protein
MFVGGKFTRYVTTVMPAVLITAALAVHFTARAFAQLFQSQATRNLAAAAIPLVVILSSFWAAVNAAPHYRLYSNSLFGGQMLFPQDDLYDAYMQSTMLEIAKRAAAGARVASELQNVAQYYAGRANRSDLACLELSDIADLKQLRPGDFVIDARGRTYFSNQAMLMRLRAGSKPAFTISVGQAPAADVYVMDQKSLAALRGDTEIDSLSK